MRDFVILFVHVIVTLSRLWGPGGVRSVVAESVLLKQQLLILNRSRKRAPNLRACDRFVAGLCSLFMNPTRVIRSTIALKPSTLLKLHTALRDRKYGLLFSPKHRRKPGPKGPSKDSSMPSLTPNVEIPPGVVGESLSRSPWLLVFPWIKMSSDASWPSITYQIQTPATLPG